MGVFHERFQEQLKGSEFDRLLEQSKACLKAAEIYRKYHQDAKWQQQVLKFRLLQDQAHDLYIKMRASELGKCDQAESLVVSAEVSLLLDGYSSATGVQKDRVNEAGKALRKVFDLFAQCPAMHNTPDYLRLAAHAHELMGNVYVKQASNGYAEKEYSSALAALKKIPRSARDDEDNKRRDRCQGCLHDINRALYQQQHGLFATFMNYGWSGAPESRTVRHLARPR